MTNNNREESLTVKEALERGKTKKLVWAWVEGDTGNSSLHCYYGRARLDDAGQYTRETHDGNSALCNRRLGISENGDSFLSIDKIQPDELNRNAACKKCLKIFDKL